MMSLLYLLVLYPNILLVISGTIHTPTKCGKRPAIDEASMTDKQILPRVFGANDTQNNTIFPWFCSLKLVYENDQYICGASLISPTELLTAAHCIAPLKGLHPRHTTTVYCGKPTNLTFSHPTDFIIHPNYDHKTLRNDIAIVQLQYEYDLTDDIQPICLPSEDGQLSEFRGWVVGRGLTEESITTVNAKESMLNLTIPPKATTIEYISNSECAEKYRRFNGEQIVDEHVCAGSRYKGTAEGDSGGPLMSRDLDDNWFLVGITSKGVNNYDAYMNQHKYPGIYVRVSRYCKFIEQHSNVRCSYPVQSKTTMCLPHFLVTLIMFVYVNL